MKTFSYSLPRQATEPKHTIIVLILLPVRRWRTDRWADCSKTCNGGERTRRIRCVQLVETEIEYDVEDEMCDQETKPRTKEDCNKQECNPEWVAQPFGVVSSLKRLLPFVTLLLPSSIHPVPHQYRCLC